MKTIRVTDEVHRELTRLLGKMVEQTGVSHTYDDVIAALITAATPHAAQQSGLVFAESRIYF